MARFLGIDIGPTALRGALVRSALRKLELERYVEIPLVEPKGSPGHLPELAQAGRNLLLSLPSAPDVIVAAIPGEECSLRAVELPAAARKRIAEVLPFELEAILPYEPRDAVTDYQPIDSDQTTLRVMAASVLPQHITTALEGLRHAGLEPRELAAGAAALDGLVNLIPELREPGPLLLVDLADHRTDLCFLQNGHCVFGRTISLGIEDMPGAAEELKHELQRTLASFRSAGASPLRAVRVCGSGAMAEDALPWLASALDVVETQLLVLPNPNVMHTQASPVFGKAAALAARGAMGRRRINLRTGAFATGHARGELVEHLNLIVTCAVIVVMTAMFSLKARQMLLSDEQQALRTELATVTKEVFDRTITDPVQAEALAKNPRSNDPLPRFDAYDAMGALSSAVSEDITHEIRRLLIEVADEKREGRMELQGVLDSLGQRDKIVNQLEQHPCFHDIQLGRTSPAGGAEQNRINYQIEAVVQCPGETSPADKKGGKKKSEVEP
jgi:Tfp pilus assembly PilM family ATPase